MKEKTVSGAFIGVLCSHLFACDKLVTQALVWLHLVHFRVVWFGSS